MPALLRSCTYALLALMLVVTSASAWLRLSAPRAPCSDWPACRMAATVPDAPAAAQAPSSTERVVRALHRGAASAVLLGTIALLVTLRRRAVPQGVRQAAAGLLVLALALSALGVATGGTRAASAAMAVAVMLGNLLGGLLMVAAAARLSACARAAPAAAVASTARAHGGAVVLLGGWIAQAALGALSGAGVLHLAPPLHLLLGLVLVAGATLLAQRARAAGQPLPAAALLTLVLLQPLSGGLAALLDAPAAAVLLHNLCAAAGVAVLASWPRAGGTMTHPAPPAATPLPS